MINHRSSKPEEPKKAKLPGKDNENIEAKIADHCQRCSCLTTIIPQLNPEA
jgi:hypothetical protein